ncbi:thioredoxin-disulfide reductase [Patescibacteria group bacterium]
MKDKKIWDVAIVGSGPSGLTAAVYTTRGAVTTIIFAGEVWGGQLMLTTKVDNWPGSPGVQGPELMNKMREHAISFGAEFVRQSAQKVDFSKKPFKITSNNNVYLARSVIVATGAETRWLEVPGEKELIGRGVSSCAPCDAPFYKGKSVAVIGGGDSAMEEALVLIKYASKVTIVHRRDKFRASAIMQEKVFDLQKKGMVEVIWNSEVVGFVGEDKLKELKVKNIKTNKIATIAFDGAFVAIGHTPSTDIFKGKLELDEKGYVKIYENSKTNILGVFVSGDVHDYHYKQAITAAGYGCQAAMEALAYLDAQ